jgi:hypothetical protein
MSTRRFPAHSKFQAISFSKFVRKISCLGAPGTKLPYSFSEPKITAREGFPIADFRSPIWMWTWRWGLCASPLSRVPSLAPSPVSRHPIIHERSTIYQKRKTVSVLAIECHKSHVINIKRISLKFLDRLPKWRVALHDVHEKNGVSSDEPKSGKNLSDRN